MKIDAASRPFRWVLGLFLRLRECPACGSPLEIVWLRRPLEPGFHLDDEGIGWDNTHTESLSAGYRCTACRGLLSWRGEPLDDTPPASER